MQEKLIPLLMYPVTRSPLSLQLISRPTKTYIGSKVLICTNNMYLTIFLTIPYKMICILDRFSPECRLEHTPDEAKTWFLKRNCSEARPTTSDIFGFNIIGTKNKWHESRHI